MLENLADLFAEFWQKIELDPPTSTPTDDAMERMAGRLKGSADSCLKDPESAVQKLRKWVGAGDTLRYVAAAQAIDRWYRPIEDNQKQTQNLDDALIRAKQHYRLHSRLNTRRELGQIIPRRPLWGKWSDPVPLPPAASGVAEFFDTLVRLPPEVLGTHPDHGDVPSTIKFHFVRRHNADARHLDRVAVWHVGFASLIEAESDLGIVAANISGRAAYDVQAVPLPDVVEKVVRNLSAVGCHIIALPEMTLHNETLDSLKRALRRYGPDSQLALVLAGSCRVETQVGWPPANEAVVLNHLGEEILRQRKLSRWNLTPDHCLRYDIDMPAGSSELAEFITPGDVMHVVEQEGLGRLAILVCEDLSRSEPGSWLRSNMLLDLQFTPILDGPLTPARWPVMRGGVAARAGSCRIVVANSTAMTYRQNRMNMKTGSYPSVSRPGIGLVVHSDSENVKYQILDIELGAASGNMGSLQWTPSSWSRFVD